MTTDDGLKGLIDFLTRYNKWRRRNDDDDSEFIEMPLPRDIGIAIDEAIGHLTKLADNVHDSGDGGMWRKLNADCNEVPCSFPCLRDDLADWKAAVAVESGRAILSEKGSV